MKKLWQMYFLGLTLLSWTTIAQAQTLPDSSRFRVQNNVIQGTQQIHFQNGSPEIDPDSNRLLQAIATFLNQHPELTRIEIQNHMDNRGTPAVNLQLSRARAESVRTRLIVLGVRAERLIAQGYGATRPLPVSNHQWHPRNRRTVFVVLERDAPTRIAFRIQQTRQH